MKIAVVGLGKIGLPLAAQYADKGHNVVGVDINAEVVSAVNQGQEPFPGEAHLQEYLGRLVPAGRLRATTNYAEAVPEADAVVVVVPLFVDDDGKPDFGWMDTATTDLAASLTADTLVIYETTLPVGTTRTRWKPMLEEGSGLVEGSDFHLVFSPERVLTGRVFEDLRKYPKLVGGLSEDGARAAHTFYELVLDFDERLDLNRANGVWDLGSAEAAEMAKLAETTYRDVNIGLANQFAQFAEKSGIDVYQVIEACNSQPYSNIHQPGIAVGGHCIPVYPHLYLQGDPGAKIVSAARKLNDSMPAYAVGLARARLGDLSGLNAVILGLTYRSGVKETAFSGAYRLASLLKDEMVQVSIHDPLFTAQEISDLGYEAFSFGEPVDLAFVQAGHPSYRGLSPASLPGVKLIIDGRNIIDRRRFSGVSILSIGRSPHAQ